MPMEKAQKKQRKAFKNNRRTASCVGCCFCVDNQLKNNNVRQDRNKDGEEEAEIK